MGATLSTLFARLLGRTKARVLMIGLDGAGKTTILYKLRLGEELRAAASMPTIGFNVETVCYKHVCFTVWDVGGQERIRLLWRHYYHNTRGIIFVVDANDSERVDEARLELQNIIETEELKNAIVLIFANKQDLNGAMDIEEVTERLRVRTHLKQRCWYVQAACAKTGDGLFEGLDWLAKQLR